MPHAAVYFGSRTVCPLLWQAALESGEICGSSDGDSQSFLVWMASRTAIRLQLVCKHEHHLATAQFGTVVF